jgi:hypothetical protein
MGEPSLTEASTQAGGAVGTRSLCWVTASFLAAAITALTLSHDAHVSKVSPMMLCWAR